MPNIPLELQQTPGLQPTELGVQSRTQSAYRGRALYDQAAGAIAQAGHEIGSGIASAGAAAVNYVDHQQINAGADHGATLFANLTDSWNQTVANADPHNPAVAQQWREEQLQPALDQFQKGFTTEKSQEWAQHFVAQMRTHMFAKTEADMSSLAADAVSTTVRNLGNKFSNTALRDATAVPAMLDAVDHSISGIIAANPNLKGEAAAKVRLEVGEKIKEQIVKAGAYGAITNGKNPEAAAATFAERYPDYINGIEAHTLAKAAIAQSKANLANDRAATAYKKQLDTLAVDTDRNKIFSDNISTDANGKVTIKPGFFTEIMKIPAMHPDAPNAADTARTLLDWGQHQLEQKKIISDSATVSGLDDRMFAPDNPTTAIDILKAESAGKMSRQDGEIRMQLVRARDQEPIKDPLFKDAIAAAKGQIEMTVPGTGQRLGQEKFVGFMQAFMGEYMKQSRAGTLPPNALNLNDPESLISKTIAQYRNPLAQSISGNGGVQIRPPAAPEIPAPLRGIAALEYSATRKQYRDQASGKIYDAQGNEIKK